MRLFRRIRPILEYHIDEIKNKLLKSLKTIFNLRILLTWFVILILFIFIFNIIIIIIIPINSDYLKRLLIINLIRLLSMMAISLFISLKLRNSIKRWKEIYTIYEVLNGLDSTIHQSEDIKLDVRRDE